MIEVIRLNASRMRINTDDEGVIEDIYTFFKYEQPGFQKTKFRKWDGVVRLFDKRTQTLPCGLLQILLQLFKDRSYEYTLDPRFREELTNVKREDVEDWVKGLQLTNELAEPIDAYDYQLEATYLAIKYGRITVLAATSAGKSLIQYLLTRFYMMQPQGKILIVVPTIMLVHQLKENFAEFSQSNGWKTDSLVHTISEGSPKHSPKPIYISTWQSIKDMDPEYFAQFGHLMVDECHLASGDSITKISELCANAYKRVGLTGTLNNNELHPLQVQAHFGPIKRVVTTKQLQDAGRAAKTKITFLDLQYPTEDRKALGDVIEDRYETEMQMLMAHPYRNKVLKSLALSLKGNTLMLFARIDDHLRVVIDQLKAEGHTGKHFYEISGDVHPDVREEIKRLAEAGEDIVIFASYQTMSTGVSIKRLHNMVFAFPVKSVIRVLQSIGRMLRLHISKEYAHIVDICDDLSYMGRTNKSKEHALVRFGYYADEGHPVTVKRIAVPGIGANTVLA